MFCIHNRLNKHVENIEACIYTIVETILTLIENNGHFERKIN